MKLKVTKRVGLSHLILWPLIWTLFFNRYATPLDHFACVVGFGLYAVLVWFVFRGREVTVCLRGSDLVAAGLFLLVNVAAHWNGLFQSLGGDELYHAERSALPLLKLRGYVEALPELPRHEYLASMWRVFDPRHMAVADISRVLSLAVLLAAFGLVLVWRATSRRPYGRYVLAAIYTITALIGTVLAATPEFHPPLRLLPWFVTQTVFGLNDFAFRLAGTLTVTIVSFVLYRAILRVSDTPEQETVRPWPFALALAAGFVPVVFYVGEAVEASVFAFAAVVGVLWLCFRALQEPEGDSLVYAGLIAGFAAVLRQSTVVLWLPIVLVFVVVHVRRQVRFSWRRLVQVFILGLLVLPYFYNVKKFGHPATGETTSWIERIWRSIEGGVGPMAIANTTTIPWLILTIVLTIVALYRERLRALVVFGTIVPLYGIFHVISPFLWGAGRYQAEYVAPFVALALVLSAARVNTRVWRGAILVVLAVLAGVTLELDRNVSIDTNYQNWPQMRLSTSSYHPYGDALRHVKRAEANGRLVMLGGSPWHYDMILWLAGHSYSDVKAWRQRQERFDKYLRSGLFHLAGLATVCKKEEIRYVVVQKGSRREKQHRTPPVESAIRVLTEWNHPEIRREAVFMDRHGGTIELYRVAARGPESTGTDTTGGGSGTSGEILPGKPIVQTMAPSRNRFSGLTLVFGTFDRENRCHLGIRVDDVAAGRTVFDQVIACGEIRNNLERRFLFSPQDGSQGREFKVTLQSYDSAPGDAVAVYTTEKSLPGTQLHVDGKQLKAGSLTYQLIFAEP